MRLFISIFSILLCFSAFGRTNKKFLYCLGQEELRIHKDKIGGAYKTLNQTLIRSLLEVSDTIRMDKNIETMICAKSIDYPSVELLKQILKQRYNSFYTILDPLDKANHFRDEQSIKEIVHHSYKTFYQFVMGLQGQLSKPRCLKEKIPELKDYIYKAQYILENIGHERLIKELKNIDRIFYKFQSPTLFKDC